VGGIRAGDVIVSVDGKPIGGSFDALTNAIRDHPDAPVTVVVDRDGQPTTLTVTPANGRVMHEKGVTAPPGSKPYGIIGVSLDNPNQTFTPLRALVSTGSHLVDFAWASIVGVGHIFSPGGVARQLDQVSSAKAASQAAANGTRAQSIVGVVRTGDQALQAGIGDFLLILVAINIFFGIFNLFPMLPLDGGHVAIAIYEKIRTGRRKELYHADVTKLMPFAWLMLAFLGVIVGTALLNDILHPMANPFG
jgi:membrane-associated protease RseP (regulator of RpoE activity)